MKNLSINGFNYCYTEQGLHVFSRRIEDYKSPLYGSYEVLKATDEDLTNGNLDYFLENGWSR